MKKRAGGFNTGGILLLLGGLAVIGGFMFIFLLIQPDSDDILLPTVFIPPTEIARSTPTASPTLTATPLPTLPPTWTPTATPTLTLTFTPSVTPSSTLTHTPLPSFTPTNFPTATASIAFTSAPTLTTQADIYPTIDPVKLSNSYWSGDGQQTMDEYKFEGEHLRFYKFPVLVWINRANDALWTPALNYSINLLSPIVPIQRTDNFDAANITVYVDEPEEYYLHCPPMTSGCASMEYDYDAEGDFVPYSWVHVLATYSQPYISVLHEMIHALGVFVHSPYPDDVMWFSEGYGDGLRLSDRDRNTLEILYALPAYGE